MEPTSRHSVLIVEDDMIVANDLQQTLDDLGYEPLAIATSAEEAVARASEKCPDLVLMDIRIKGRLDGISTAGLFKEQFDVPIVFLTARAELRDQARGLELGGVDYVTKPFNPLHLAPLIEDLLARIERGEAEELRRERLAELRQLLVND